MVSGRSWSVSGPDPSAREAAGQAADAVRPRRPASADQVRPLPEEGYARASLACCLAWLGELDTASDHAEAALVSARRLRFPPVEGFALRALGRIAVACGAAERGVTRHRAGLDVTRRAGLRGIGLQVRNDLGVALRAAGHERAAVRQHLRAESVPASLRRAVERFDRLSAPGRPEPDQAPGADAEGGSAHRQNTAWT